MDYSIKYFYITIHFLPKYEETEFTNVSGSIYKNTFNDKIYQKKMLYDFGWGQENGFELLPTLTFTQLIKLVEQPSPLKKKKIFFFKRYSKEEQKQYDVWHSNLYGAVSIIMQEHIEEFIDFLHEKINTDYFSNSQIRNNFKCFSFSSEKTKEMGRIPGGILTQSYETVLNQYPKWNLISKKVIEQIYLCNVGNNSIC